MCSSIRRKTSSATRPPTPLAKRDPSQKLVTLTTEVDGIVVSYDEAILKVGSTVGYVSYDWFGHRSGKSVVMGYVSAENAVPGTTMHVEILGEFFEAEVLEGPIYDANGANMRCK